MALKILIADVRRSRKMSQDDLARLMGQSRTHIQNLERGRSKSFTVDTLNKLCEVLECQPGDFLQWTPD